MKIGKPSVSVPHCSNSTPSRLQRRSLCQRHTDTNAKSCCAFMGNSYRSSKMTVHVLFCGGICAFLVLIKPVFMIKLHMQDKKKHVRLKSGDQHFYTRLS